MEQLISSETPTAKKKHRCDHCAHFIPKGAKYLKQFCVDGGHAWTWRAHIDCHDCAVAVTDKWDDLEPLKYMDDIPTHMRGRFPHVICRLEFWGQINESNWMDTP